MPHTDADGRLFVNKQIGRCVEMSELDNGRGRARSRRNVLGWSVAGGFAVTASGLLAACRGEAPSTASRDTPSGRPRRGGTLTVGMISEGSTESVDPWTTAAATPTGYLRVTNLYDTLFQLDDELNLQPALAESAEVSADKKTWTFRLRGGVTFHDGSILNADDVIHNVRAWANPSSWASSSGGSEIDPQKIDKVDDRTVRIGLTGPHARFDGLLAFLAFSIKSRNERKVGKPIGTGPFRYVSFTPGSRSEFARFPDHWRADSPHLERLVVNSSFTDETARTNALKSGQVGLLPLISFPLAKTISTQVGRLLRSKSGAYNNFYMAVDTPPFNDVRVRQAMRLLVNRQELVDVTYAGLGSVSNDVPGRYATFYDDSLVRGCDVDQARSLLRKAGKEDLTVTLQTSAVVEGFTQAATLLKQQAKAAGVTVNLNQVDPSTYWSRYGKWTFAQAFNYPVPSMDFAWTNSYASTGIINATHWYKSPSFQRTKSLLRETRVTDDKTKLADIWHELQMQQFNEGGEIIYGTYDYVDAVASNVQGLTPSKYLFASGCNLRKAWLSD